MFIEKRVYIWEGALVMFIDCQLVFTLINVSLAGGTCRQCKSFVLWKKNDTYTLQFHNVQFSNMCLRSALPLIWPLIKEHENREFTKQRHWDNHVYYRHAGCDVTKGKN